MNLTRDQERAAYVTGIDMCVRAGAGSGKTRVLIERAVRLLTREEDPLRLTEILAITFTEKAALEMKVRLADELEKHRGHAARAQVQWAWVGTIYGFCSRLLRENAVEAGVDPSFAVLDEDRTRALLSVVFDETAARWSAQREGDLELLSRIDLPDPTENLLGLHAQIRGAGLAPADLGAGKSDSGRFAAEVARIVEGLSTVAELLPGATPAGKKIALAAVAHLEEFKAAREASPSLGDFENLAARFKKASPLRMKGDLKEVLKEVKEDALPEALAALAEQWAAPAIGALRGFLVELDRRYRDRKDELGVLDFTDLEARALALLEGHPELRANIAGRFRQVLVDEYQDVNPLQERIIRQLRMPGTHFAVGDVKQSIYGFRYARPELLRHCADEAGENGTVDLATNFRSSPGLVEFTNHCFGPLFAPQKLVDWTPMEAGADYLEPRVPEVELVLTEGDNTAEYREREARALATRIRQIVDGGEFTLRRESDRRGERVSYRDIAILFRSLGDLKTYERALEDHDVPYYVVKGGGFYQAREIVDLVNLLRIVRNPRDEIALAAVLRSPFAALSDDALLALALERPADGCLADLLAADGATGVLLDLDRERWDEFCVFLRELRELAGRVPLRELVLAAIEISGYADLVWMLRGGRRHVANFRKALALAESFEGSTDLAGFVRALEEMKSREVRETEAPTGGEAEDVVRILTVHGAKGLEFPVVFLPDLGRGAPNAGPPIHFDGRAVAVKALAPSGEKVPTPAWTREEEERKRREAEENLRVLYVAVTRAEEHLVLLSRIGGGRRSGTTFWDAITSVLDVGEVEAAFGSDGRVGRVIRTANEDAPKRFRVALATRHRAAINQGEPLGISSDEQVAWARSLLERVTPELPEFDGTCYQNTISELLLYASCRRCYYDRYVLGIPRDFEEGEGGEHGDFLEPAGADELPATDRGIAVHEVLRVYDPSGGEDLEVVARRRLQALRPGGYPDETLREVVGMVQSFYECEIGEEVLAAKPARVRREMPFFVRWEIGDPGIPDLLLRGQIDLLYPRRDGSLAILDYKTGRSGSGRYDFQLRAYARALSLFQDERVAAAGLVYLAPSRTPGYEAVDLGSAGEEEMDRIAAAFSRELRTGIPADLEHTKGCPHCD